MSSTVRYKKFPVSKNEELKDKGIFTKYKILLIIGLVALAVILVASLAIGIGVGIGLSASSVSEHEETMGLNVLTVTEVKLEGEYYGSSGGIYFLSTVNGSDFYLLITTLNGDTVFIARKPQDTPMTLMSVNDTDFLVIENDVASNQPSSEDYMIPKSNMSRMKAMIETHPNRSEVMDMVVKIGVNDTISFSLEQLVMRTEAILIIQAALALGKRGLTSKTYPSTLPFYVLALRIASVRDNVEENTNRRAFSRQKRSYQCPTECQSCPYAVDGNSCFGLCGRQCNCWEWVCGDCCLHKGCLDHDQCCEDMGFYTSKCLLPFNFNCVTGYKC